MSGTHGFIHGSHGPCTSRLRLLPVIIRFTLPTPEGKKVSLKSLVQCLQGQELTTAGQLMASARGSVIGICRSPAVMISVLQWGKLLLRKCVSSPGSRTQPEQVRQVAQAVAGCLLQGSTDMPWSTATLPAALPSNAFLGTSPACAERESCRPQPALRRKSRTNLRGCIISAAMVRT